MFETFIAQWTLERWGACACACYFHAKSYTQWEPDALDKSALHKAAMNGHIQCMEALVERGWDVNKADASGCTALHIAAKSGQMDAVKWLVDQGVDIRVKSKKGNTARQMASNSGNRVAAPNSELFRSRLELEPGFS